MKEKTLLVIVCLLGIAGVCYGMATKDRAAFVIGLILVVAGYLMIRKKLKAYIREKYPSVKDLT